MDKATDSISRSVAILLRSLQEFLDRVLPQKLLRLPEATSFALGPVHSLPPNRNQPQVSLKMSDV